MKMKLITYKQFGDELPFTRGTWDNWWRAGKAPHPKTKKKGKYYWVESEVDKFLASLQPVRSRYRKGGVCNFTVVGGTPAENRACKSWVRKMLGSIFGV